MELAVLEDPRWRIYDFALASAAVALDLQPDGIVNVTRIAIGGLATKPWRAHPAASLGRVLDEASASAAAHAAFVGAVEHRETGFKPLQAEAMERLYSGQPPVSRDNGRDDVTAYAFGAQFVEVRVYSRTPEIRVPRMVGAFAAGTIVNPLTVHSQLMGGMIWGIGAALLEQTEIDPHHAGYVNDNIAEYLIPMNADVRQAEVIILPERDTEVNRLGIKASAKSASSASTPPSPTRSTTRRPPGPEPANTDRAPPVGVGLDTGPTSCSKVPTHRCIRGD